MSDKYQCPRCAADPHPAMFGSPRNCAFTADGTFTPDNWNCATLNELREDEQLFGNDESMQIVRVESEFSYVEDDGGNLDCTQGFVVLTRYKQRGCCSSAIHVGDFWPAQPLTLTLAEHVIRSQGTHRIITGG